MGRLALNWVCVFALVALHVVGCGENGAGPGGMGGFAGIGGMGGFAGTGGMGGFAGTGGMGGFAGTGGTDMTSPTAAVDPTSATLGKAQAITVTFSESIDTATLVLGGALAAESDGGVWSMTSAANDTLTISPTSSWTSGADRDLMLDADDLAGNALAPPLDLSYLVKLVFGNFDGAAVVVGQADFMGTEQNQGGAADANTLSNPFGSPAVENGRLFVGDFTNNRVLAFDALPTVNDASADFVLGQPDFTTTDSSTAQDGMAGPLGVVTAGSTMVVTDFSNARVLIYNSIPTDGSALPDVVVGQSSFDTIELTCAADRLSSPGAATVTPGGKLIVSDYDHHRVLVWNALPTTNGQAADMVLGQSDMTECMENAGGAAPTASTLSFPFGVWADDTRLVVADSTNHRVLIWTAFPTTDFQSADLVLGQESFTNNAPNNGGAASASTMWAPLGGVHSNGVQLAVTDADNNRTLIWNSFPTASFQPADTVLGQENFTNNAPNDVDQDGAQDPAASESTQHAPSGALFHQDKLLISDSINNRLLIYPSQ